MCLYLFAPCFVYIAIGLKLRDRMPSSHNADNNLLAKVGCFIVGSFMILIAIPDIIIVFVFSKEFCGADVPFWCLLSTQ